MTPPHWHISFELLLSAGMLPTSTVGEPGTHGAVITGMHGIGVNAPSAAAVAAATAGLELAWHMAKGMMFAIGLLSMIVAMAMAPFAVATLFAGGTDSAVGAAPK